MSVREAARPEGHALWPEGRESTALALDFRSRGSARSWCRENSQSAILMSWHAPHIDSRHHCTLEIKANLSDTTSQHNITSGESATSAAELHWSDHTDIAISPAATMSEQKTKKFQKGERVIPSATDKALKYYPAEDVAVARKVCQIR